ncbi:MAG: hypothetical protein EBW73_05610 [Betaproteobacteria bacterium]|nr:hypothetical protein [Betaproteobacteria bacterium]
MDEQKQKRISITLAVLMHAALAAFLLIGLSWKNQEPPPVQAELWLATEAAKAPNPKPEEPRNELAAEPVKPKPEVAPEAPEAKLIPRPPPKVVEPKAADIALQKKKEEEHRKEEAKRLAEERKRQEANCPQARRVAGIKAAALSTGASSQPLRAIALARALRAAFFGGVLS